MTRVGPLNHQPYIEAVIAERLSRDASMLGVHEDVAGFEVMPLTLWHLLILRIMRHPLLTDDAQPSPEQLSKFLWLIAPEFAPGNAKGRKRFILRCKKTFYPPRYMALLNTRKARARHDVKRQHRLAEAARIIDSARAYLKESMQDRPAIVQVRGFEPDYYSDGIAFCAKFAREFGWHEQQVLQMPMKRLFQYLNEMKIANGSTAPLCNPSDAVSAKFYGEINASLKTKFAEKNAKLRELTKTAVALAQERKMQRRAAMINRLAGGNK